MQMDTDRKEGESSVSVPTSPSSDSAYLEPRVSTFGLRSFLISLLLIVGVAVIAFGGWWGYTHLVSGTRNSTDTEWQAVFLVNGQVYFGKLAFAGANATLKNVYYLQVSQTLQDQKTSQTLTQPDINLIKLGQELHGPEDVMYIPQDKIMFWENMRNDSKIVEAITSAKK